MTHHHPTQSAVSGHVRVQRGTRGDTFYAKWRGPDGRQRQTRLGKVWREKGRPPEGYLTKRMAEAALRELLADAQRGTVPGPARSGATLGAAVAEWLRYIEEDKRRAHSTVSDYRCCGRVILDGLGDVPLERVTTAAVERWRTRLLADGLSPRTVQKYLTALGGVFRRARKVWGIKLDPLADVELPEVRRSGDFAVLDPEGIRLLAASAATEQDGALFLTAGFTGLRQSELLGLRWGDVDFARHLVHVRRAVVRGRVKTPKSGKVRSVPLMDEVARALDALSRRERFTDEEDYVFPSSTGAPSDESKLRWRFRTALTESAARWTGGNGSFRFHDLRHSFGTLAVQVFPLSDVQAYMGHANIETTMRYVHHVPAHDAAERLERAVAARSLPALEEVAA
jgi:integrase